MNQMKILVKIAVADLMEKNSKMPITYKERKTPFIGLFDKTPEGINCPHFWKFAVAIGCPYQCSYCYLLKTFRGYTRPVVYTNVDKMLNELRFFLLTHQNCVLNSGELADSSLLINHRDNILQKIAPLFNEDPNGNRLLLLTKSANISGLLKLNSPKNIIASFSVNTADFIAKFESGTAKIEDRLKSAKITKEKGFETRLRIDPMVPFKGWKEGYLGLVKETVKTNPDRITLGTLRFFSGVKGYAKNDGRGIEIFNYGTEKTPQDGRMRVRHREYIYSFVIKELLKAGHPLDKIGLCKETPDVFNFLRQEGLKIDKKTCNCTP